MKVHLNLIVFLLSLIIILLAGILGSIYGLSQNVQGYLGRSGRAVRMHGQPQSNIEKKIIISPIADRQAVYACDGASRADRQCVPGYTQACVPSVACKCADGWEVNAGPVDGCVKWQGAYIPKGVEGYAFEGECAQVCRLTGRAQ